MVHASTKANSPLICGKQICKCRHVKQILELCVNTAVQRHRQRDFLFFLLLLETKSRNKKKLKVSAYMRFCRNAHYQQLFLRSSCVGGNAAGPPSLSSPRGDANYVQLILQKRSNSRFLSCDSNQGRHPSHFTGASRHL